MSKLRIEEMYLRFNEEKEPVKGIMTFGNACCYPGHDVIAVKSLIDTIKGILKSHEEVEQDIDKILKEWEKSESDHRIAQSVQEVLTHSTVTNKSYYSEKFKEFEELENNLYLSYYRLVHTILENDEVQEINKKIGYNFVSNEFINNMIIFLENKEV